MASKISLSECNPKARIKIASGILPGTEGNETLKFPSFFLSIVTGARKPLLVENTFA